MADRREAPSVKRRLTFTRIYSDEAGETHFGSLTVALDRKPGGALADPEEEVTGNEIGLLSAALPCKSAMFRQTPGTYNFDWHCAPARQFIINLDAPVTVQVTSGEERTFAVGECFFVEDTTGKGHFSRAVDGQRRTSLFLPVDEGFDAMVVKAD